MQWNYSQSSTVYELGWKDSTAYQNALLFMYGRIDTWVICFLFGIVLIILVALLFSIIDSTSMIKYQQRRASPSSVHRYGS
jgi:hypothetical protein